MKDNFYPENGSVVIVDDKFEEALPLIKVLSKMDVSFKYFNGNAGELPATPLDNVRIVFLDIELEGMEGVTEDKTKLSALKGVISKIVSEKCQPYIIIAWTKHQELAGDLSDNLKELSPLFTLCIDKSECKVNEGDEFDIKKISDKLIGKINEFGSFEFFLKWQNISNRSSGEIINDISSIYPFDGNWNNNTNNLLVKLAEAYEGKQVDKDNVWKYAMLSFNSLFIDIIESNIFTDNVDTDKNMDMLQQQNLDDKNIIGEINKRLHISLEQNNKPIPGNIYIFNDDKIIKVNKKDLIESIFNGDLNQFEERTNLIEKSELIHLEVSPFCDYAQNKWERNRILSGVKWPEKYKGNLKKADYIYKTPLFKIDNDLCYFIFDIRFLTSIELEKLDDVKSKMRVRKELLNDIQTKIAGHINRPGITYL
ncbi:MAG: hypothetical protein KA120_06045 [Candidatus Goldbacteria bacterium]|nr:hypothetical protein [Candidatus Goldiibacteriota bacterium]